MPLGLLGWLAIGAAGALFIGGIIYLSYKLDIKLTIKRLKKLIQNEKRIDDAVTARIYSMEGNTVKLDVLNKKKEKIADFTVTGSSVSHRVREGKKIAV